MLPGRVHVQSSSSCEVLDTLIVKVLSSASDSPQPQQTLSHLSCISPEWIEPDDRAPICERESERRLQLVR